MKIFILLSSFILTSFSIAAEKPLEADLENLINACLKDAHYYQVASKDLSWFVSTEARSYIGCGGDAAEGLYDYLGRYADDNLIKLDGKVQDIKRWLSSTIFCTHSISEKSTRCRFNLDIDEDIIKEEEESKD